MPSPAVILVNGKRANRVSALDHGLAYGDGVFRTMRLERGAVVHWPRHYAKLAHDCARIGIVCPDVDDLASDISRLARCRSDGVIKIIVTRGAGGRGYAIAEQAAPTRIAASFPRSPIYDGIDECGAAIRWCRTRAGSQPALAGIKHLNRLENVLARAEWSGPEIAEGLMVDTSGAVVEGTMSNVFILEQDRLVTPVLDQAGVAGVQRDRVMQLAPRLGLACETGVITPERLEAARQVYLTNSVIGCLWCGSLGERRWERSPWTPQLIGLLRTVDE